MTDEQKPFDPDKSLGERLDVSFALKAAGLGVWEVDPVTKLVNWDDRCRELVGLATENKLPYDQFIQHIHADDRARVEQARTWAMNPQSGGSYDVTFRTLEAQDGLVRWVRLMGQTYFNEAGEIHRFAGVAQPVDHRYQLQQLSLLVDHAPEFMPTTDLEGHVQLINKHGLAPFDLTSNQLTGKRVLTRQRMEDSLRQVLNLFEQSPVGIAIISEDNLTFRMANPFYGYLVDRQPDELVGKPLLDALPELAGQGFDNLLREVITTGVPFIANEVAVDIMRHDQLETIYVDLAYQPQYDRRPDGGDDLIRGVLVIATDVTQQVLARKKIEESEARFRSLIEEAPVATGLYVGREMIVEVANEIILGYWGKDASVLGKPLAEALPELEGQPFLQLLDELFTTGRTHYQQGARADLVVNGVLNTYYFDYTYKPLRNMAGEVYAIMNMAIDVTEQVAAHRQLAESEERYRILSEKLEEQVQRRTEELMAINEEMAATNEELASANEEYAALNEELEETNQLFSRSNQNLEQFAYIASHDLQEPLRKVQQFGDLLKEQYADRLGEGIHYLERMQSASSRMSRLIKDLLAFSRISTRQEAIRSVSLTEVVKLVINELDLRIQETGAVVELDHLPTIQGDQSQLEQLFQNLLNNALKFRKENTIPRIAIRSQLVSATQLPISVKPTRAAKTYFRIDVVDNGIGFDEKYIDRIFQVFQRLHGKQEFAGTGIGLAICEKVATNHGGAITASSRPGHGATFSVYFPV